jgi:AcrR family transcriptional regulator
MQVEEEDIRTAPDGERGPTDDAGGPGAEGPAVRAWSEAIASHRRSQRSQILAAFAALMAEEGLAGLSMSRLAGRSGVSRATLYRYFSSVGEVANAWIGEEVDRFTRTLEAIADEADLPEERLRRRVDATLRYFSSLGHRRASEEIPAESALSLAVRRGVEDHLGELHRHLAGVLGQLAERVPAGSFPDDPNASARVVISLLGAMRTPLLEGEIAPEMATEMVLRALRADRPASSEQRSRPLDARR